ncbi:MAG TPA: FAD-linked oxidase C-terminal domain-containing protein [Nitrospirota bacterium]|nr:FAD-linked oxidase C-terminal domain-containing protein [Nitrospirota bacterium]
MLKPSVVKELKNIVGPAYLSTSPEDMVAYSYDATQREVLPWAVARPVSAQEVSKILRLANRDLFPVVPRGAGTGMSGGSVPVNGGLVLSLERMNRILEIDDENLVAVVQPGVVTGELQREVEARGLFYPPDPASNQFCTIGGNVAECAGGLRAVKYGVTKDYVLGLEVVLPTGEIIRTGARTAKSVAGYDLTKLIVGSEGTLGVATTIILRLLPLPECVRTISAFFNTIEDASTAAAKIIASRIIPRALEFVDGHALRAVESYLKEDIAGGATAMLLVEVDGAADSTTRESERIAEIMTRAGAPNVKRAETDAEREQLWKARRAISPALYTIKPKKVNEDIVVPRSRIPDILREIEEIAKRYELLIVNFGHAGDGNIHTNIMIDEVDTPRAESAVKEIFESTLRMGGSISGEHGIGLAKAAYLPMEVGPAALAAMRHIKQALDPNNILNPGKIFMERQDKP